MPISLSGSLLVTGSITTSGTITAQTLVVQTITSSIVNMTGSNIFGSQLTDRQTFTGSMYVTGSSVVFAGNLGIGVNLSNWATDDDAIQIGGNAAIYSKSAVGATKSFSLLQNAYDAAGGFTYISTDYATRYNQISGQHQWYTAPSATAGAIMTFTQSMTLTAAGNLGIGTASPTQKLHVSGSGDVIITAENSSNTAGVYLQLTTPSYNWYLMNNVANTGDFRLRYGSSYYMTVLNTGNVGIGTTSPSATLQINNPTTGSNALLRLDTGDSNRSWAGMFVFQDYFKIQSYGAGSALGHMSLQPEGNNVGIGTTTMTYAKLSVYNNTNDATYGAKIQGVFGPAAYQDSDATQNYGAGTSETQFLAGTTARPAMISLGGDVNAGEGTGVINFFRSTNTDTYRSRAWIWSGINSVGTTNQYGGFLAFSTAADAGTNPQERMRITSSGSVGIATSTPFSTTKLHVVKDASTDYVVSTYAGSGILLSRTTGGGEQLGLRIGNASTNGISGTNYPGQLVSDGNNIMEVYTTAGSPLVLGTNSAERIRITGTGLVGINNSSPQARLDLGSGYGASGEKFFVYNDDNASALAGTKMGFYIDRFSESNSVAFVFPYAPATTSRYHVAYKNTSNTTITDVCYVTYNSTSWTFPSDERMKNVEGIITNALDKIKDLRAVYYTQKRDPEQKRKVGLLAQDLLKVLPEVVDVPNTEFDEEGNQKYMSVALGDTIPLLVKAIQELTAKVTALENK